MKLNFYKNLTPILLRLGGAAAALLLQVFLGREYGSIYLSDFYIFLLFSHVISTFSLFGFNVFITKFSATNTSLRSSIYTLLSCFLIASSTFGFYILLFTVFYYFDFFEVDLSFNVYYVFAAGFFQFSIELFSGFIRGLHRSDLAQFTNAFFVPVSVLLILVACGSYLDIFKVYIVSSLIVFVFCLIFIFSIYNRSKFECVTFPSIKLIIKESLPFMYSNLTWLSFTWFFSFLALMLLPKETFALFKFSEKFSLVTLMILQALSFKYSSQYASLYSAGKLGELQRVVSGVSCFGAAISLPFIFLISIFSYFTLSLVDENFLITWYLMPICLFSYLVLASSAGQQQLLVMAGFNRVYGNSGFSILIVFGTITSLLFFLDDDYLKSLLFFISFSIANNTIFIVQAFLCKKVLGIKVFFFNQNNYVKFE